MDMDGIQKAEDDEDEELILQDIELIQTQMMRLAILYHLNLATQEVQDKYLKRLILVTLGRMKAEDEELIQDETESAQILTT